MSSINVQHFNKTLKTVRFDYTTDCWALHGSWASYSLCIPFKLELTANQSFNVLPFVWWTLGRASTSFWKRDSNSSSTIIKRDAYKTVRSLINSGSGQGMQQVYIHLYFQESSRN